VVVAIVVADIAFAVDSIPAAFAVTRDPVVIWTANVFALLGLGSLLALVDILVRRFRYLGKTVALILAFVGIKILADDLVHISDLASLGVIAALLAGGVATSVVADRLDPPHPTEEATRRPPRCPERLAAPRGPRRATRPPLAPVANPRGKTRLRATSPRTRWRQRGACDRSCLMKLSACLPARDRADAAAGD
jgi:hypothetical protein